MILQNHMTNTKHDYETFKIKDMNMNMNKTNVTNFTFPE